MTLVDSYALQYEVKAEYPYSTHIVDTEEEVLEVLRFEKDCHGVRCQVRVVGPWTIYNGDKALG